MQDAGNDMLQVVGLLCGLGRQAIDFLRDESVDFGAGEFFEQSRFFALFSLQEGGETVLRQHDRAGELRVVESDDFGDAPGYFALGHGLFVGRELSQRAGFFLVGACALHA